MRFFSQCLGVDKKVQSADSKGDRSCNKDYLTPSTEKESKKKKSFSTPDFDSRQRIDEKRVRVSRSPN